MAKHVKLKRGDEVVYVFRSEIPYKVVGFKDWLIAIAPTYNPIYVSRHWLRKKPRVGKRK